MLPDIERGVTPDLGRRSHGQYPSKQSMEEEKPGAMHYEKPQAEVLEDVMSEVSTGETEQKISFNLLMSLVAMSFLWTGSQVPLYLFGSICPEIYGDIGGEDRYVWFILGHLVSIASVCPFVGSMSDILGRRYLALTGTIFCIVGMVVCAVAKVMNVFIGGMVIAGIGAGINELTALSATSEMAPASKRGTYNSLLVLTILPFIPSGLYANLIAANASWRYITIIPAVWNVIGFLMVAVFYFPPPRANAEGLSRKEVLQSIDYGGGFLFIGGIVVFLAGIQWGGYQYEWTSAHVLVPLFFGAALLVAFGFYEMKIPTHPIIPHGLGGEMKTLLLTMLITFISGCNFFAFIMFWPTQSVNVYGDDAVQVGLRSLPIAFGILGGSVIGLWLVSLLKGHIRELLVVCCVMMTLGTGGMAYANADNLNKIWGFLVIGSIGIGGIVVPASIISTIVCPDHLIATVSALTMSVRMIGGAIGYSIYYNVFSQQFKKKSLAMIGGTMMKKLGITDQAVIVKAINICSSSLLSQLKALPGIDGNQAAYDTMVRASRLAFADCYKYVYYVSIAFGVLALISACFLRDIKKHMDNHVAVVMH